MASVFLIMRRNPTGILGIECAFDKAESAETIANGLNNVIRHNDKGTYDFALDNVYFTVEAIDFFRTITAEG